MENQIRPYDMEFMKMAILKHEQTFKEQVNELHRLYRIQKILMKAIPKNAQNGRNQDRSSWNSRNGVSVIQIGNEDYIQPKPKPTLDLESDGDEVVKIEDESQIELTLGPTSYYQKKKVETPINSDSGHHSFSSSSTGSSHIKRTSSETQLSGHKWGLMEEHMIGQDRLNQGPWIFQAMSLNMT